MYCTTVLQDFTQLGFTACVISWILSFVTYLMHALDA